MVMVVILCNIHCPSPSYSVTPEFLLDEFFNIIIFIQHILMFLQQKQSDCNQICDKHENEDQSSLHPQQIFEKSIVCNTSPCSCLNLRL